ncbi:hypothetical protein AGDE_14869 [Angomonas deanei]|uniref:Uncharacterized protein n=1 Tax=Angomonas deanei TaxID=59799 RepID=A0A7G2CH34_9TRYP|nr:hypothetical protein AGDE_14869 [Angomonas deanei]CAD2218347.1 hypothetical protein, conserved [Angomonas deanei]|eukprot:EPY20079.1 hypothetical protein AGDE_14869 [Angomonas deanei]
MNSAIISEDKFSLNSNHPTSAPRHFHVAGNRVHVGHDDKVVYAAPKLYNAASVSGGSPGISTTYSSLFPTPASVPNRRSAAFVDTPMDAVKVEDIRTEDRRLFNATGGCARGESTNSLENDPSVVRRYACGLEDPIQQEITQACRCHPSAASSNISSGSWVEPLRSRRPLRRAWPAGSKALFVDDVLNKCQFFSLHDVVTAVSATPKEELCQALAQLDVEGVEILSVSGWPSSPTPTFSESCPSSKSDALALAVVSADLYVNKREEMDTIPRQDISPNCNLLTATTSTDFLEKSICLDDGPEWQCRAARRASPISNSSGQIVLEVSSSTDTGSRRMVCAGCADELDYPII